MIAINNIERVVELTGGRTFQGWHRAIEVQYGKQFLRGYWDDDYTVLTLRRWLADQAVRTLMSASLDQLNGNDRALVVAAAGGHLF